MVPHWVAHIEDYIQWVRAAIYESGGILREPGDDPHFLDLPLIESGDIIEVGFTMFEHRIEYPDASSLWFTFTVIDAAGGWEYPRYRYHFQPGDGSPSWRYDKHRGHEDEFGNLAHFHHSDDENDWESGPEVDLGDVLDRVHKYLWPVTSGNGP